MDLETGIIVHSSNAESNSLAQNDIPIINSQGETIGVRRFLPVSSEPLLQELLQWEADTQKRWKALNQQVGTARLINELRRTDKRIGVQNATGLAYAILDTNLSAAYLLNDDRQTVEAMEATRYMQQHQHMSDALLTRGDSTPDKIAALDTQGLLGSLGEIEFPDGESSRFFSMDANPQDFNEDQKVILNTLLRNNIFPIAFTTNDPPQFVTQI